MIREIYERSQRERVLQERSRRSSIAQLLHDRAHGDDEETFTPNYEDDESDEVDPANLGEALSTDDQIFYAQMVSIEPPQVDPAP